MTVLLIASPKTSMQKLTKQEVLATILGLLWVAVFVFYPLSTYAAADSLPLVSTHSADKINHNSAVLHGYVNPYGTTDTTRYIAYGTSPTSLAGSTGAVNQGPATGLFDVLVTGLTPGTIYYFQAVAQNSAGTR